MHLITKDELRCLGKTLYLLDSVRIKQTGGVILARFRPHDLIPLKQDFIPEMEANFRATRSGFFDLKELVDQTTFTDGAVSVTLSEETISEVLSPYGHVLDDAPAVFRLSDGSGLSVVLHRGLNMRLSYQDMQDICIGNEETPLEAYMLAASRGLSSDEREEEDDA